ncbi:MULTISPECIES: OadG family protein [Sporomusa]|uniref:Oxaloacetate decarboxylase, gamma chain n=1 Tax=Sporomusa sphaeroides DSM 2875 TaxID=1337886 RepID=A0ABM9W1M1_9FIRM|nr:MULTISPECIES: OadG family protein [Sporomusa]OLS56539.1 oxaloacetate decarboxylase, gamma chain [Sporomusa sphaeroides DSM 2875]CVK19093.1 Oxaloacetate decarboxylase, gamma chain [Sporomusa sphaeroides DSM 2875]
MEQPVTTNPLMISLINLLVVFAVLYALIWVIKFIRIIDPTREKNVAETKKFLVSVPATVPEPEYADASQDKFEIVAVISAAIAAYGYSPEQIVSIRPAGGKAWFQAARLEGVSAKNQSF